MAKTEKEDKKAGKKTDKDESLNAAQKARQAGETVPIVYVEIEALAPPRSRLANPRLTTETSLRPVTA